MPLACTFARQKHTVLSRMLRNKTKIDHYDLFFNFGGGEKHRPLMLGTTFLLGQAHAPDAPQQETPYKDASVALAKPTPAPTYAQPSSGDKAIPTHAPDALQQETPYKDASVALAKPMPAPTYAQTTPGDKAIPTHHPQTSTSKRAKFKQQAELDKVAKEVNFSHADSSGIYKQGIVQEPLRHSCDLGAEPEEVQQVLRLLLGIGQVDAPGAPHQAALYKDPSPAYANSHATEKSRSVAAGPPCAPTCHACGSVAKAMPVQEAARLLQRQNGTAGRALECMNRLKHGLPFTCKDGNPLPPHVTGWHKDYFMHFQPSEESKRMQSKKSVWEMQALLEKETEMLLNALRDSEEPTSCIYELKCFCNTKDNYLCVVPDRAGLGLQRRDIKRTKFQDRKKVSESFWWMFAAIEWEDNRVGSKRKKTT